MIQAYTQCTHLQVELQRDNVSSMRHDMELMRSIVGQGSAPLSELSAVPPDSAQDTNSGRHHSRTSLGQSSSSNGARSSKFSRTSNFARTGGAAIAPLTNVPSGGSLPRTNTGSRTAAVAASSRPGALPAIRGPGVGALRNNTNTAATDPSPSGPTGASGKQQPSMFGGHSKKVAADLRRIFHL